MSFDPRRPLRAALVAFLLAAAAGTPCAAGAEPPAGPPAIPPPAGAPGPSPAPPADPGVAPPDAAAPDAAPPPAGSHATPPPAAAVEHGDTAGGALAFFMSSRDYRTIRDLRSIMTAGLRASYDKDPTPYNGKKGIRLSAFDYREPAPKAGAKSLAVTVTSLWEDQGEAVEKRTETVRLSRDGEGPWRAAAVERVKTESVRFKESIAGVTSLRMVLRAWVRRDLETAKGLMTESFLKRQAGRPEGIEAVFAGDPGMRRAGFRILDLTPHGAAAATARIRLIEAAPGRPSGLEGVPRTLEMVKKGSRWLLDDWR